MPFATWYRRTFLPWAEMRARLRAHHVCPEEATSLTLPHAGADAAEWFGASFDAVVLAACAQCAKLRSVAVTNGKLHASTVLP